MKILMLHSCDVSGILMRPPESPLRGAEVYFSSQWSWGASWNWSTADPHMLQMQGSFFSQLAEHLKEKCPVTAWNLLQKTRDTSPPGHQQQWSLDKKQKYTQDRSLDHHTHH